MTARDHSSGRSVDSEATSRGGGEWVDADWLSARPELVDVLAVLPVSVWAFGQDGMSVFMSSQWFEMTGQTYHQAQGSGWEDVVVAEDKDRIVSEWHALLAGEREGWDVAYRVTHGVTGSVRFLRERGRPHRAEDGTVMGCAGVTWDETEQREGEQRLRGVID